MSRDRFHTLMERVAKRSRRRGLPRPGTGGHVGRSLAGRIFLLRVTASPALATVQTEMRALALPGGQQAWVRCHTPAGLLAGKIAAFLTRGHVKGRDVFGILFSQQALEAILQPFTRLFSDQRLKRHAKALIPGVIAGQSPHITKAIQDGGEPDVGSWAQAKRALFASRGRPGYRAGDGAYVAPDAANVCGGVVSHVLCHPHPGMLAAGSPVVAS